MKLGLNVIAPALIGVGGAGVAAASTVAQTLGVSALLHSSGAAILSSVGIGGTGYIAGTIGGVAATGLALVSAPVVIGAAASIAAGGAALAAKNLLK